MKLLPTTVSRARARVNQADRLLLSDHGPGVEVRNEATGREYWIGLWQMESRVGGER